MGNYTRRRPHCCPINNINIIKPINNLHSINTINKVLQKQGFETIKGFIKSLNPPLKLWAIFGQILQLLFSVTHGFVYAFS